MNHHTNFSDANLAELRAGMKLFLVIRFVGLQDATAQMDCWTRTDSVSPQTSVEFSNNTLPEIRTIIIL